MIEAVKEVDEDTRKVIQKILRSLIDMTGEKAAAELAVRTAEITEKREQYKRKLILANKKRKAKKAMKKELSEN